MKSLTRGKMWCYAIGQLGWSIISGLIGSWLVYFYQPNQEAIDDGMISLIPEGRVIFGVLTIIGLITAGGRIFDAITDPLLAFLYDRVNTPFGKVRPLMLLGWLIQSLGVYFLFNAFSSKGHGIPVFLACYMLYL